MIDTHHRDGFQFFFFFRFENHLENVNILFSHRCLNNMNFSSTFEHGPRIYSIISTDWIMGIALNYCCRDIIPKWKC